MEAQQSKKKSPVNTVIDGISGIFMPIVNQLSGTGILKGILALVLVSGVMAKESDNYQVLHAMADGIYYFLPLLLAFTAAKQFGANPFTAVVIGCVLLYPALMQAVDAGSLQFIGLPVTKVNYTYSVFPIIMAVGLQKYVEQGVYRILPKLLKDFLTPLLCIVAVSAASLLVLGPAGKYVGDLLAKGYNFVYELSPIAAGTVLGGVIQIFVIFGFQWSLVPIALTNISLTGRDTILCFFAPPVFAQAGAAMAVFLKSKDKAFKATIVSAAVSAVFGVTEPAMYGVNLPLKKPMAAVCISGAVGGAIAGMAGASAGSFAFPGIATMPVFIGKGFGMLLLACGVSMVLAFVLTLLMPFDADAAHRGNTQEQNPQENA